MNVPHIRLAAEGAARAAQQIQGLERFFGGISKGWNFAHAFADRRAVIRGFAGEKEAVRVFPERVDRAFDNACYTAGPGMVMDNRYIDEC